MSKTFVAFFVLILSMTSCATNPPTTSIRDVEDILQKKRWDALDSALLNYKPTLNDKFIGIGDKDKTVREIKAVAMFLMQYDICDNARQPSTQDQIIKCNENLREKWNQIPRGYPILSKDFSAVLNDKKDVFVWRIREATMKKTAEEEKARRDNEETIATQNRKEREWKEEANKLLNDANDTAVEMPKYVIQSSSCHICEYTAEKKRIEQAITEENSYSNKYGVINLSKIDRYKQTIMQIDRLIVETKKKYKVLTGKNLGMAQCKDTRLLEACEAKLKELQDKIALQIIADKLNLMQDKNEKQYIANYLKL